jgi:hypothetical protein
VKRHLHASYLKYGKQDQQGKVVLNERSPTRPSNKNQRSGSQEDQKQKQDNIITGSILLLNLDDNQTGVLIFIFLFRFLRTFNTANYFRLRGILALCNYLILQYALLDRRSVSFTVLIFVALRKIITKHTEVLFCSTLNILYMTVLCGFIKFRRLCIPGNQNIYTLYVLANPRYYFFVQS